MKSADIIAIQLALNANNLERRRHVSRSETRITADLRAVQVLRLPQTDLALTMAAQEQARWRG